MVCRDIFARHSSKPHKISAPINLQLAQKHYHSRFLELRELIMAEESKFKLVPSFYNLYI